MAKNNNRPADPQQWAPETQLVHGGSLRSQFGETSEAMFLTQGFVYDSPEQAEARFKSETGAAHQRDHVVERRNGTACASERRRARAVRVNDRLGIGPTTIDRGVKR